METDFFGNALAPLFAPPPAFTPQPDQAPALADVRTSQGAIPQQSIFARAVCVQLATSRLGTRRKVDTGDITTDADRDLLHVSADILQSPELTAIKVHDRTMQEFLRNRASGPALFKGGVHLIALALVEDTDAEITRRLDAREALVTAFLAVYEKQRDATAAKLGGLADRVTWPTLARVRDSFAASIRYLAMDTPQTLKGIKAEIFERERVKAEREWGEAMIECRQVLRAAFADLVEHLAERLAPAESGGKPKVFRDSLIGNFDEFVKTFTARNIADDDQLADLVRQAQTVMRGVSAQDLRDQEALRAAVARSMADIKDAIDPLVAEKPTRAYNETE